MKRMVCGLLGLLVVVAACGGDDGGGEVSGEAVIVQMFDNRRVHGGQRSSRRDSDVRRGRSKPSQRGRSRRLLVDGGRRGQSRAARR